VAGKNANGSKKEINWNRTRWTKNFLVNGAEYSTESFDDQHSFCEKKIYRGGSAKVFLTLLDGAGHNYNSTKKILPPRHGGRR
jgi:hypothetical protein